ncbi:hypothetical protein A2U01_0108165, partial [Trifolium medium]|nr:hypothetical protein [Trifolium medium]
VLKRTGPEESHIMPHQSVGLTCHRRHPAEDGELHSPGSKHPENGFDAPTVLWSVSENAQSEQSAGDTPGSM